jgi:sodium-dependent phosphate cotransporter
VAQSGGGPSVAAIAMLSAGALTLSAALFFIFGTFIGKTITANLIALLSGAQRRKDFRHGFEIALTGNIYSVSLFVIATIIEIGTGLFSKTAQSVGHSIQNARLTIAIPNAVEILTGPIVTPILQRFHILIVFIVGFILLLLSLEIFTKSVLHFWGGPRKGRAFIKKYMGTTTKAFFAGLLITLILPSTNLTVSLLIPLAVAGVLRLRVAVPFIIGANVGTTSDVILASFIVGGQSAIGAGMAYLLVPIIGAIIWLPFCKQLHDTTKYFTKRFTKISRQKALLFSIIFIAIPILLLLI